MILEVIATSVADAIIAEKNGAGRIELISGICEGGVTPSYGLIEQVVASVSIPVNVMIRPHSNSFCYDEWDLETMLTDIRTVRRLGAAGIVTGCLTPERKVDTELLEKLLAEVGELSVTFHRAIDETDDLEGTLHVLAQYPQIHRVLTSGGKPSVLDARDEILRLQAVELSHPIAILAGSGLNLQSLASFIRDTGVREVHMGTGVRRGNRAQDTVDPELVRAAADIVAGFSK
ncbi:copper homeostasis protein CutC [Paenibacillus oleatilyticus]|uniref:copper homeostasis protein CutC n=1 Tax=Paenibacillus oleatilyticus TaxID=2594886 RepID=UPI001C200AEA|nr:copper homeostasis protein CutC [Paenibacillus oleatilyticus]MBU7316366.1 copper homeostasis protein CutC [Paenibacillus oleatilyticus]